MSDTQIIVTQRESPRRLALAAALGVAAGVAIGFTLANVTSGPFGAVAASAPAAAPAPAAVAAAPAKAAPPMVAIPVAATATVPAEEKRVGLPQDLLSRRLVAGKALLDDEKARFSVQLMLTEAKDREYLEGYLGQAARALEPDKLYLVPAGTPETPRIGVLFGGFPDRGQANTAMASLPAELRLFRPYVRSLDIVREDARRAQLR